MSVQMKWIIFIHKFLYQSKSLTQIYCINLLNINGLRIQQFKKEGNIAQLQIANDSRIMNPRYGQMLKTLKVAYPEQIPPYQQQMMGMIKDQLKVIAQEFVKLQKQIAAFEAQLSSITSTQIINLPENQAKRDQLNFTKTKMAVMLDQYYRIKRFMLIYSNSRLNKVQEHFWHFSGNLKTETKNPLSEPQRQYFNDYKAIATEYMQEVGLELTLDIDPPIDASVQVRFLKDCGQILSDDGQPVNLQKNAVMYIKKRLVQNFIKDKSAQVISHHSH